MYEIEEKDWYFQLRTRNGARNVCAGLEGCFFYIEARGVLNKFVQ